MVVEAAVRYGECEATIEGVAETLSRLKGRVALAIEALDHHFRLDRSCDNALAVLEESHECLEVTAGAVKTMAKVAWPQEPIPHRLHARAVALCERLTSPSRSHASEELVRMITTLGIHIAVEWYEDNRGEDEPDGRAKEIEDNYYAIMAENYVGRAGEPASAADAENLSDADHEKNCAKERSIRRIVHCLSEQMRRKAGSAFDVTGWPTVQIYPPLFDRLMKKAHSYTGGESADAASDFIAKAIVNSAVDGDLKSLDDGCLSLSTDIEAYKALVGESGIAAPVVKSGTPTWPDPSFRTLVIPEVVWVLLCKWVDSWVVAHPEWSPMPLLRSFVCTAILGMLEGVEETGTDLNEIWPLQNVALMDAGKLPRRWDKKLWGNKKRPATGKSRAASKAKASSDPKVTKTRSKKQPAA